ncbi:MAG: CPBP family intramembrane glutamic endopeptidase [Candidatus Dormibacteria bacterium]
MEQKANRDPGLGEVATSIALAYVAFGATFRGPRRRFWTRMTRAAAGLAGYALVASPELRRMRPRGRDLLLGGAIAGGLYGVFALGDRAARLVMPHGAENIGDIYQLRQLRPRPELTLRLALVIAPAEELYWRGLLQRALARRYGRIPGAAMATGLYGGAHLCTGNATLVGAATVAGGAWSGLAALDVPMPALVVSHVIWDIWIFLVRPTNPGHA